MANKFSLIYHVRHISDDEIFSRFATPHDQHGWANKADFLEHVANKTSNRVTIVENGYKELSSCGTFETTMVAEDI